MSVQPLILGIETSCDETACALVERSGRVRVNAVASQIDLHAPFGGVVPEVASRRHIETLLPMVLTTLEQAGVGWDEIDAIAVTRGPGLIGCLLMGVETAKALAWRYEKPLIAVHHLHAHLHAPFVVPEMAGASHLLLEKGRTHEVLPRAAQGEDETTEFETAEPDFPHLGLIVSGGHTSLVLVRAPGRCEPLASTRDDAVGEAYDKIARVMDLGYPGGPVVDRLAAEGDAAASPFTPPLMRRDVDDFSFSGLKSAVAREVERRKSANGSGLDQENVKNICAGFQSAVIEVLLAKSLRLARRHDARDLLVVGGVASNRGLRRAAERASRSGPRIWFPHPSLCTDNAAMIAALAWHIEPLAREEALVLNPESSLPIA